MQHHLQGNLYIHIHHDIQHSYSNHILFCNCKRNYCITLHTLAVTKRLLILQIHTNIAEYNDHTTAIPHVYNSLATVRPFAKMSFTLTCTCAYTRTRTYTHTRMYMCIHTCIHVYVHICNYNTVLIHLHRVINIHIYFVNITECHAIPCSYK